MAAQVGPTPLAADASRVDELERTVAQLQHALDSRVVIEQAKGIIAERHGVAVEEAFEVLRQYARSHGLNLHDVAAEVIAGAVRPVPAQPVT